MCKFAPLEFVRCPLALEVLGVGTFAAVAAEVAEFELSPPRISGSGG